MSNSVMKLRKKFKSEVLELTPESCKLIMNSGGPTFKPCGRGFRCNQTGEFVGKKTIAYANRISGIANTGTQKHFEDTEAIAKLKKEEDKKKIIEALPIAIKCNHGGAHIIIYCPNRKCLRPLGSSKDFHTWSTCEYCGQGFRV